METPAPTEKNETTPTATESPIQVGDKINEPSGNIPVIEQKPVIKKHHGHQYKETCKCAMCKRITARNLKPETITPEIINAEEIIKNFIQSLDDQDKAIIHFNAETKEVMKANIEYVKKIYGAYSNDSLNKLVNDALISYLKIYIHHDR